MYFENNVEKGRNCSWGAISSFIHNILLDFYVETRIRFSLRGAISSFIHNILLDFYVETRIRFSLRDKRLFKLLEVDCIYMKLDDYVSGSLVG